MKKFVALIAALVLTVAGFTFAASAEAPSAADCNTPTLTETRTVHHDAVTETVHHPAVTETTPEIWEVFSPNNTQGPFEGTPTWPTDSEGTWQEAAENIPPGHEGPDGVYQQGNGNGSWFYRQAEKVVVITPAFDEEVVVTEAFDETIRTVTPNPDYPCDKDTPKTPDSPDEPRTVNTPKVNSPAPVEKKQTVEVPTVINSGL